VASNWGSYNTWKTGDNKQALDDAVDAFLAHDDHIVASQEILPEIVIPLQTLQRALNKKKKGMQSLLAMILMILPVYSTET
jgi:hypothetical protein